MYSPPPSPTAIATALVESLTPRFTTLCQKRYAGPLHLRLIGRAEESTTATVRLVMERLPHLQVHGVLVVRHVGGNVYDVQGIVDDRTETSRSFTYCLSEDGPPAATPHLAQSVAAYLLDTTERLLGRQFLRDQLRSPTDGPSRAVGPERDWAGPKR